MPPTRWWAAGNPAPVKPVRVWRRRRAGASARVSARSHALSTSGSSDGKVQTQVIAVDRRLFEFRQRAWRAGSDSARRKTPRSSSGPAGGEQQSLRDPRGKCARACAVLPRAAARSADRGCRAHRTAAGDQSGAASGCRNCRGSASRPRRADAAGRPGTGPGRSASGTAEPLADCSIATPPRPPRRRPPAP